MLATATLLLSARLLSTGAGAGAGASRGTNPTLRLSAELSPRRARRTLQLDDGGSWVGWEPEPEPGPPEPQNFKCQGARCVEARFGAGGKNYRGDPTCESDCQGWACKVRGGQPSCVRQPNGTFSGRGECDEGCHTYRCAADQCIEDDDHGTYTNATCDGRCHLFTCQPEVNGNGTEQCVIDPSGLFPDETCGETCRGPSPPPPRGDWGACASCSCRGTDLSALQNDTYHAYDTHCGPGADEACYVYAFRLCGSIPQDELPQACREFSHNASLVRYKKTDKDFCEPLARCDGAGGSKPCLWGRKESDGFGALELQFRSETACGNRTETLTIALSKGEEVGPETVYSLGGDGCGECSNGLLRMLCHTLLSDRPAGRLATEHRVRWAGLPENPRPLIDILREPERPEWPYIIAIVSPCRPSAWAVFSELHLLLRQVVLIVAGVSSPAAICSLCLREKMCGGGGAGAGAGGAQRRREGSGMLLPPDSSMSPSVATSAGSIQSMGSAAR